jgi:hypothetical protein
MATTTELKSNEASLLVPSTSTMQHAVKLALSEDRPILLDYWAGSSDGSCFIGVRENEEKLLVKNEDEYTSPVGKIYAVDNDYIITTENSLYVVNKAIGTKRIA